MRRRHIPLLAIVPALPALSACGISLRQPSAQSADRDAPRIDARAAFEAVTAGRAILVDVRGESAFRVKRAAGAILLPLDDVERAPAAALRALPAGKQPILYCT